MSLSQEEQGTLEVISASPCFKGYCVTIDNLSLGYKHAVKWGPLIQGNCEDKALLRKLLDDYQSLE